MVPVRRGFTLIELLVVMLVIGVLAGIAYGRFRDAKARGYKSAMTADLGELRIAEEGYWAEHAQYSTDSTQLDWHGTSLVSIAISSTDLLAGFDAQATHPSLPGVVCKVYVGRAVSARPSGEIYCQ